MKKLMLAVLVVAVALAFSFRVLADESKTVVKDTGKKVVETSKSTTTTAEGTVKDKERVEVTKEGIVDKEKTKIKTAAEKETIKREVDVTAEGVKGQEEIKIKEKGKAKETVEATASATKEGKLTEEADVALKRKGLKKENVVFKSYNEGSETITVVKGDAELELPTASLDKWTVHPKKMKKGNEITIYSTYDPKLVKNVVKDAEAGKVLGEKN